MVDDDNNNIKKQIKTLELNKHLLNIELEQVVSNYHNHFHPTWGHVSASPPIS